MSAAGLRVRGAEASDDAALRALLRQTPLPGAVSLTMEREPSFFGGDVDAVHHEAAFVTRGEALVACGSRYLKRGWWQGREADLAYLGDLRVHPAQQRRGGWALRAGYQHLQECAEQRPAVVTWTVIFEGNQAARRILVGRAAGLPSYEDRGRLLCPVILAPRGAKWPSPPEGFKIETGARDWNEVCDFLNAQNRHRPLAPVHDAADFAAGKRWPGLDAADWIVMRKGGRIVGCVAVWDVRAVRQMRVHGYGGWLGRLRLPLKWLAQASGHEALPQPGSVLTMAYASFLAAEEDSPQIAAQLLRAARAAAAQRGLHFLCACLHERDPLAPALRGLAGIAAHGRLYEVVWPGQSSSWTPGHVHIEPAAL